jgi:hypothetical protein
MTADKIPRFMENLYTRLEYYIHNVNIPPGGMKQEKSRIDDKLCTSLSTDVYNF